MLLLLENINPLVLWYYSPGIWQPLFSRNYLLLILHVACVTVNELGTFYCNSVLELNYLVLAVSHLYTRLSVHSLENDSAVTSSLSTHRPRPLYSPALMSLEWALWIVPFINDNLLLFKLVYQILSHLELRSSVIDCLFFPHYTLDWDCGGVCVLGGVMATELFGGGVFDGDEIVLEQ